MSIPFDAAFGEPALSICPSCGEPCEGGYCQNCREIGPAQRCAVTPSLRDRALALCEAVLAECKKRCLAQTFCGSETHQRARALKTALAAEPLDRDALAREIALHVITLGGGYDGRDCSCGARWPETDMGTLAEFRARHLADVVLFRLARGAAEPSE
jgi:hypothetical protein